MEKIKANEATYSEAHDYAIEVGKLLAQAYQNNLHEEGLPNGRMYYNIAQRVIEPTMLNNYELVTDTSGQIQESLYKKAEMGIRNQKPVLDHSRISNLIDRVSNEEQFSKIKWILDEPIIVFTQHVVDEAIRTNADFQAKSGMRAKIIRHVNPGACEWCHKQAGTYLYGDEPSDVYRRHQNCRCKTDYDPGDGRRQNVWSKKWNDEEEKSKIEERKEFSKTYTGASGAKNYHRDDSKDYLKSQEDIRKEKHAYREYDRIKNSNQELEKRKIFNNIGSFESMKSFSKEDVDVSFNHVFNIEHDLDDGRALFKPDFDMAQSWNRLINNADIQEHDLIMLLHERLEHDLMYKVNNLSYLDAHNETNKRYNYTEAVKLFNEGKRRER